MFSMRFDMRAPDTGAPAKELYAAALDMAEWGEQNGCVAATLCEHHSSDDGYLPSPLIMASAMAARTCSNQWREPSPRPPAAGSALMSWGP